MCTVRAHAQLDERITRMSEASKSLIRPVTGAIRLERPGGPRFAFRRSHKEAVMRYGALVGATSASDVLEECVDARWRLDRVALRRGSSEHRCLPAQADCGGAPASGGLSMPTCIHRSAVLVFRSISI